MSTIQPISGHDLFVWPDGEYCTREEHYRGGFEHRGDDFEVVPYDSARYHAVTTESTSLDTSEREATA